MTEASLIRNLLLPELRLVRSWASRTEAGIHLEVQKESEFEVCPRCAGRCRSVYDHRVTRVKDAPIRGRVVHLHILKRRFSCARCKKPFTEPVPGVLKGRRTTERYCRAVLDAAEQYVDLTRVRQHFRCSSSFLYRTLYRHLELQRRKRVYPFPRVVGIDEHYFRKDRKYGGRAFVTMVVDHKNRRLMEVVQGKTHAELEAGLCNIEGRQNVERVLLDLSDTYKSFAKRFFPNALLVADKFHVLRLLNPHLNRRRRELLPQERFPLLRRLLLMNHHALSRKDRWVLYQVLQGQPVLRELYWAKEALHRMYRTKCPRKAKRALIVLCDTLALSSLPELRTLRGTLIRWQKEILQYFYERLTNARTEGFNLKAKLVKRRAYGYRSFQNYRLRLLNACA